ATRLPATLELTLVAMVVSVVVGIPLGVVSALWRNSWLDHAVRVVTVSGLAIASFWLGIMLQLLFAMRLGWTPLNGRLAGFPPRGVTALCLADAALSLDWPAFGRLLAGAVVTEAVFDWPGIGTYAVNSIIRSDYNAVMGFTVWAGTIFIVVNLLVDVAHTMIDPRERAT